MFADDIERNSNEIEYKYGKKLVSLTKMCTDSINEQLDVNFPECVDNLKKRYTEQVGEPVKEINKSILSNIEESCFYYLNRVKNQENNDLKDVGYNMHLNNSLEQ